MSGSSPQSAKVPTLAKALLRRLLLAYSLFAMLLTGFYLIIEYRNARIEILDELESLAATFAPGATSALWEFQDSQLDAMVQGIGANPLVTSVDIRATRGNLAAQWRSPRQLVQSASLRVEMPLDHDHKGVRERLGTLVIASSDSLLEEQVIAIFLPAVLSALSQFLFLGLMVWLLIGKLVVRPLAALSAAVGQRSQEELTTLVDIGKVDIAEIATLQSGFNRLLRLLDGSLKRIAENNVDLEQKEARMRTILDNADAYIYLKDPDGHYLFANRLLRELWHAELDEIVGCGDEKFFEAVTAKDIRHNDHRVLVGGETLRTVEITLCPDSGARRYYQSTKLPLYAPDGSIYALCGISIDISARVRAEDELTRYKDHLEEQVQQRTLDLMKARDAAEAANRAKSLFLSNMSHELRTPLNAILGFAEMISRNPDTPEFVGQKVAIISRSGEHLLSMINDVLDLSKIEAGKIAVEAEAIDLPALIEDIGRMFEVRADSAGLRFSRELAADIAQYVIVDSKKLRQVLINLLGNAVKFTREGGFALRVRTQPVDGEPSALSLHLEVQDSGPGIPADQQQNLFKPFVQLAATASSQKGTGLGLSISKSLVELMGGRIGVDSVPGQGALFWIDLPVQAATVFDVLAYRHDMPHADVIALAPDQPVWRILVAEDNPENRLLLVSLLTSIGFEVREAANGKEAVDLFEPWQPHFIWMDMRMPVQDGYEATERIRALPGGATVKIVALTASVFREQRQHILDVGCNDIVHKPYRNQEIFDAMAAQIGVRYLYREPDVERPTVMMAEAELIAAIAALAPTLRSELIEAAECGDQERFEAALIAVLHQRADLAEALKRLSDNYQFDRILNLLTEAVPE